MAAVLSFGIYKVKMPARRVDAFDVSGQSEANQIAANIGVFKHRLVFCCVRKADSVLFLSGDSANLHVAKVADEVDGERNVLFGAQLVYPRLECFIARNVR